MTCIGRTQANNRCQRGPSGNLHVPCDIYSCLEINERIDRLAELPLSAAAEQDDLLHELAQVMFCANNPAEPNPDEPLSRRAPWPGHIVHANLQVTLWRQRMCREAGIPVPPVTPRSTRREQPRQALLPRTREREQDGPAELGQPSPSPSPSPKRRRAGQDSPPVKREASPNLLSSWLSGGSPTANISQPGPSTQEREPGDGDAGARALTPPIVPPNDLRNIHQQLGQILQRLGQIDRLEARIAQLEEATRR
jgi:hypothetical protein